MWPRSTRWDETVVRTHTVLAYAQILIDGEVALTVDGSQGVDLDGGRIPVGEGVVRRTAILQLTDRAGLLLPDSDLIIPDRSEIRVWAGLRYWDATPAEDLAGTSTEYVPVFTGPLQDRSFEDYPTVALDYADRMAWVQRPFSAPYTVVAGLTIDDAAFALLQAKIPPGSLDTDFPATAVTTKLLVYDEQSDPADGLRSLGTSAGWTIYADPMGVFLGADEPELDPQAVVMSYEAGPLSALIKPKLAGGVRNIVNTWVVSGESPNDTTATPWAKVVDDNPASPTYVRGPYDERPRFVNLPVLTTDAQCQLAAQTYRRREGGLGDVAGVEILPNPALEKGDVLKVTGGVLDRLIIADSFEVDLTGRPMEVTGRAGYAEVLSG